VATRTAEKQLKRKPPKTAGPAESVSIQQSRQPGSNTEIRERDSDEPTREAEGNQGRDRQRHWGFKASHLMILPVSPCELPVQQNLLVSQSIFDAIQLLSFFGGERLWVGRCQNPKKLQQARTFLLPGSVRRNRSMYLQRPINTDTEKSNKQAIRRSKQLELTKSETPYLCRVARCFEMASQVQRRRFS
jgi:hypothetical protein